MEIKYLLETVGYKINDRKFSNLKGIISVSANYNVQKYLAEEKNEVMYWGAEHKPADSIDKLPNVTVLPNFPVVGGIVLGSTFGHHHDMLGGKRVQELYEFWGFGALLIDHDEDKRELYIASPGDKVAVPNHCHMTLFNLGLEPLITFDMANPYSDSPLFNSSNKDVQNSFGSRLFFYRSGQEVVSRISNRYINSGVLQLGTDISLRGKNSEHEVYLQLKTDKMRAQFTRMGIEIIVASPSVDIGGVVYDQTFKELLHLPDTPLQRFLGLWLV